MTDTTRRLGSLPDGALFVTLSGRHGVVLCQPLARNSRGTEVQMDGLPGQDHDHYAVLAPAVLVTVREMMR